MPATLTPRAAWRESAKLGPTPAPASCMTTSLRRYGPWPLAVRVDCALARFSAVTSMRTRSAESALPEASSASKRPTSAAHRGFDDVNARLGDRDERLVLEAVARLGGGLDGRAVGADGGGGVTLGGERGVLQRGPARRHGVAQGRVEVHVDALVARGVDVGQVLRDRLLASGSAHDGLLESGLSGVVNFHGTGRIEWAGG